MAVHAPTLGQILAARSQVIRAFFGTCRAEDVADPPPAKRLPRQQRKAYTEALAAWPLPSDVPDKEGGSSMRDRIALNRSEARRRFHLVAPRAFKVARRNARRDVRAAYATPTRSQGAKVRRVAA